MQKEQATAQLAVLIPVRDALAEAVLKCPIKHYETLLRGQLSNLDDWVAKLEAATRGEFVSPPG